MFAPKLMSTITNIAFKIVVPICIVDITYVFCSACMYKRYTIPKRCSANVLIAILIIKETVYAVSNSFDTITG